MRTGSWASMTLGRNSRLGGGIITSYTTQRDRRQTAVTGAFSPRRAQPAGTKRGRKLQGQNDPTMGSGSNDDRIPVPAGRETGVTSALVSGAGLSHGRFVRRERRSCKRPHPACRRAARTPDTPWAIVHRARGIQLCLRCQHLPASSKNSEDAIIRRALCIGVGRNG